MKKLTSQQIKALLAEARANSDYAQWEPWYKKNGSKELIIEFPLGEITNPKITGYIWAWGVQKRITTLAITGKERFNAQGLEGKAQVKTGLVTALLVWEALPAFRCNLYQ